MMSFLLFRSLITLITGFLYLLSEFFPNLPLDFITNLLIILLLVSFYPYLNRMLKIVTFTLLFISFMFYWLSDSLPLLFYSMDTNLSLLMIFIFVPLLSIPIREGRYLAYVEKILNYYVNTTNKLYLYLKLSVLSIGSVMNLGSIPIIYQLTDIKTFQSYETLRVKAINRSFSLAFLWSPYFISMAFVLTYFNVTWLQLFIIGITMAVASIIAGILFEYKKSNNGIVTQSDTRIPVRVAQKKLMELVLIIVSMTALVIIFEYFFDISILTIIALVAIGVTIIWTLFFQSTKSLFINLARYTKEQIPYMGNEMSLFLVAGVFGTALLNADLNEVIIYLLHISGITHALFLVPIIMILLTLFSFAGIHPVITMSILGVTLSTSEVFINDHVIISMGVLAGWSITVMLSPFSAVNLTLGNVTDEKSFFAGFKHNWKYAIMYALLLYGIMCVIYYLF